MNTRVSPTIYDLILQTSSCPQNTAALLNEAERLSFDGQLHWNAKRLYPYWKACEMCGTPFTVQNNDEYHKRHHCSQTCATESSARKRRGKKLGPRKDTTNYSQKHKRRGEVITCPVCGKRVYKPRAWLQKVDTPTCSRECNGKLRSIELIKHSHKGRAGWTEESLQSYRQKMSGPNNPAWKGGVTYRNRKGNYRKYRIKYVRCPDEFISMARRDGYVMEHRLIVAQHIGRPLKRSEVVHHVDHNPENNDPANLELFASNSQHKRYEATGEPEPLWRL